MKSMDNAKVIKKIEKISFQKYLEKLIDAKMHKITLFASFPYTGAANLSDPQNFVMIDELKKIVGLNGGCFLN